MARIVCQCQRERVFGSCCRPNTTTGEHGFIARKKPRRFLDDDDGPEAYAPPQEFGAGGRGPSPAQQAYQRYPGQQRVRHSSVIVSLLTLTWPTKHLLLPTRFVRLHWEMQSILRFCPPVLFLHGFARRQPPIIWKHRHFVQKTWQASSRLLEVHLESMCNLTLLLCRGRRMALFFPVSGRTWPPFLQRRLKWPPFLLYQTGLAPHSTRPLPLQTELSQMRLGARVVVKVPGL